MYPLFTSALEFIVVSQCALLSAEAPLLRTFLSLPVARFIIPPSFQHAGTDRTLCWDRISHYYDVYSRCIDDSL